MTSPPVCPGDLYPEDGTEAVQVNLSCSPSSPSTLSPSFPTPPPPSLPPCQAGCGGNCPDSDKLEVNVA